MQPLGIARLFKMQFLEPNHANRKSMEGHFSAISNSKSTLGIDQITTILNHSEK